MVFYVYNFVLFLSSFLIFGCWYIAHKKANYKIWEWQTDSSAPAFVLFLWNLAPIVLIRCTFNIEWLQIWIAPKVWLIEYAVKITG